MDRRCTQAVNGREWLEVEAAHVVHPQEHLGGIWELLPHARSSIGPALAALCIACVSSFDMAIICFEHAKAAYQHFHSCSVVSRNSIISKLLR